LETSGLVLVFFLWLSRESDRKTFARLFCLLGIAWGAWAWLSAAMGRPFEAWTGFPNPKHLAVFLIPLFFISFPFPGRPLRIWNLLGSLFAVGTMVLLRATGALLGLASGMLFLQNLSRKKALLIAALLLSGGILLHAVQPSSTQWDRWIIWKASIKSFGLHPLLGGGPGIFAGEFHRLKEPRTGGASRYLMDARFSHNELLEFLTAFGLIGGFFLAMGLWRWFKENKNPENR